MSLENFDRTLVRVLLNGTNRPYIRLAIFAPADDMLTIIAESRTNLAARILIATKLRLKGTIPEVVQSDPGIITGDQELGFPIGAVNRKGDSIDARDLATFSIAAAR